MSELAKQPEELLLSELDERVHIRRNVAILTAERNEARADRDYWHQVATDAIRAQILASGGRLPDDRAIAVATARKQALAEAEEIARVGALGKVEQRTAHIIADAIAALAQDKKP